MKFIKLFTKKDSTLSCYYVCLLLFVLFSIQPLNAQQREINFERISIEQGLSQSTFHSIIQEKTGFI